MLENNAFIFRSAFNVLPSNGSKKTTMIKAVKHISIAWENPSPQEIERLKSQKLLFSTRIMQLLWHNLQISGYAEGSKENQFYHFVCCCTSIEKLNSTIIQHWLTIRILTELVFFWFFVFTFVLGRRMCWYFV